MAQEINDQKSALESYDDPGNYAEPWEIPVIIALVILAALWLLRTHHRNQKLREKGSELCRKSLEK